MSKKLSSKNKTIILESDEVSSYLKNTITLDKNINAEDIINKTILGDFFKVAHFLPKNFIDLLIIDPPYNINKKFGEVQFNQTSLENYTTYFEDIIKLILPSLKKTGSIYVCSDIFTSPAIYIVLKKYFYLKSRITWQREKGRGAKNNWKNSMEDIWFATVSNDYYFDTDSVKIKRRVIAPYKENGKPKDFSVTKEGNFRLTHASNFWDDITIPYWSMPENTTHPTQKPEKLLAKLILASSKEGDIVFDPFSGSGSTAVTAKKLLRNYLSIELDKYYAALIEYRLYLAKKNKKIQGFENGVFWERNTYIQQKKLGKDI